MASTRIQKNRLTPRKLPRQGRSEATVEAILQAAAQVFERYGYAAGTTNRIASRAGVSIGSLYQYFPNKDAILVALVRHHLADGAAVLASHVERLRAGERLDEVIPDVVNATAALHMAAPGLHRVLFEETPLPRELRSEIEAMEGFVTTVIAEALSRDLALSPESSSMAATVILTCVEALTHRLTLRPPEDVTAELVAAEVTTLVSSYLRSLAASSSRDFTSASARPPRSRA